ncbi:MAG: ParB N-terminal domain-containing protein [Rickettsiales bacterium]|jgi:DNA modification methylase|nr:ParB N-terminal domain-containing protein [Rickettsiales bacterium]
MGNLHIENVAVGQIRVYAKNAKNHPEKQVQQIAASIKEFGFNNPILIDENSEIIAGHGRLAAAHVIGLETVPVIRLSHLSDAQKRAYRLADNKIGENGGWNADILRLEIAELEEICGDLDISITGFADVEIDVLENPKGKPADPKANAVPYIPENEIITQLGDVWRIGEHRVICGDSLKAETFERLLGDSRADMILQDPPFNVKIQGHVCGSGAVKHKEFAMASGEMSVDEFTNFLRANFALCAKFSKAGSLHLNFMDWRHIGEITAAGGDVFSGLINMCVWVKSAGGMGSLWRSQHELCFVFKNGREPHTNNVELGKNGRYRTNVWQYAGVNAFGRHKNDIKLHPTVKPVEMLKDAILDVSKRGDIVLDSFLGSGSTLIAAHQAKRICYGVEFEPLYVDTTIRRFRDLFGINAVRESDGKTYSELLSAKQEVA